MYLLANLVSQEKESNMAGKNRRPLLNFRHDDEGTLQKKPAKLSSWDSMLVSKLWDLYFAEEEVGEESCHIQLHEPYSPPEPTAQTWLTYKAYILNTMQAKISLEQCDEAIEIAFNNRLFYEYRGEIVHLAASLKDETFLGELLRYKRNLESCFKDRVTALMVACDNPNPKSAEALIKAGANVNAKDCEGKTPLHYAARNPYKEVAEALLSNGSDVNTKDNTGCTPLMMAAAFNSNAAIAELLLEKGADLYAQDNQGWNALDHAKMMNRNPLIQDILIGRGLSHALSQDILDVFPGTSSIPFDAPVDMDQTEQDAIVDSLLQDSLDCETKPCK